MIFTLDCFVAALLAMTIRPLDPRVPDSAHPSLRVPDRARSNPCEAAFWIASTHSSLRVPYRARSNPVLPYPHTTVGVCVANSEAKAQPLPNRLRLAPPRKSGYVIFLTCYQEAFSRERPVRVIALMFSAGVAGGMSQPGITR